MSYPLKLGPLIAESLTLNGSVQIKEERIVFETDAETINICKDNNEFILLDSKNIGRNQLIIKASVATLWEIMLSNGSIIYSLLSGRIKFPIHKLFSVINVLNSIRFPNGFYLTISDHM